MGWTEAEWRGEMEAERKGRVEIQEVKKKKKDGGLIEKEGRRIIPRVRLRTDDMKTRGCKTAQWDE